MMMESDPAYETYYTLNVLTQVVNAQHAIEMQ